MESNRIRAEVRIPDHVVIPRNRKTVAIPAEALIHNDGDDHIVLGAEDPSQVHHWQILDESSNEVLRLKVSSGAKKVREATIPHCSALVPSGLSLRELEKLVVPGAKLEDGRCYVVRHTHWGLTAEARFVAVQEPERAKRASGRAAGKKKAAAGKKGKRRQGGKKRTSRKRRASAKRSGRKKKTAKKKR